VGIGRRELLARAKNLPPARLAEDGWMRLTSLTLTQYGSFQRRTEMGFRYGYPGMRLMAEALERARLVTGRERLALEAATRNLDGLRCDAGLLDAGAAIDDLVARSAATAQALRDIPGCEAERGASLLRQLGSTLTPAQDEATLPGAAALADARRLFPRHEKLRAELDRLPRETARRCRRGGAPGRDACADRQPARRGGSPRRPGRPRPCHPRPCHPRPSFLRPRHRRHR
jgi:hypothetical protein